MKHAFKPLGIAAAVAAATAGYSNVASAQMPTVSANGAGDLALIPYYTVREGYVTGVHVINSSNTTQVVKIRLRRAPDSMDALDFNVVLSPEDMWVGFLNDDENGDIFFNTGDNSCTAPATSSGRFQMPDIYRDGADEGYIEVFAMGQPSTELMPIAVGAKHNSDGEPADCTAVRSNFFSIGSAYPGSAGSPAQRGVITNAITHQAFDDVDDADSSITCTAASGSGLCVNTYVDSPNALKVSYFIRDNDTGVEFGGEAVHIQDFLTAPAITNQQNGLSAGDRSGFDYPDLNGGAFPAAGSVRTDANRFNMLRQTSVLGALAVYNDWSANPANGVTTDWVLTMPGQYTMLDLADYTDGFSEIDQDGGTCSRVNIADNPATAADETDTNPCDRRDLPVQIDLDIYDREEGRFSPDPGDLVVSPQPPAENPVFVLDREVNVIQWAGDEGVLSADQPVAVDNELNPLDSDFGWANVSVTSSNNVLATCEVPFNPPANMSTINPDDVTCTSVSGRVPVIGMVAWKRNVAANPNASYGRIVEHAYVTS